MQTTHQLFFKNAASLPERAGESVDLIVTSPPYPMIEMWDSSFATQNPLIAEALADEKGERAFDAMHRLLDPVWHELFRILREGGIACINVGDATRTMAGNFQLYPNYARVLSSCVSAGFQVLPMILWRKPTNAPNKFMGSGMMPPSAYVTLEHEYVILLRKGEKRSFGTEAERERRRESAFFWEERNRWFSDVWTDLKGETQRSEAGIGLRERTGAFPFELAYRLVNMFSMKGDTVLDPFAGTGTTLLAALASERNSIGVEICEDYGPVITDRLLGSADELNRYLYLRLEKHHQFVEERKLRKGPDAFRYWNPNHRTPVVTNEERRLMIRAVDSVHAENESILATYQPARIEEPVLI